MREMTIGELARAAGVNVETIRFYQREGLLEEPVKPSSGYRRYPQRLERRLRFIKRAQALGFTLAEVVELLELEGLRVCPDARELAARKLEAIDRKVADLCAMREALAQLMHQCQTGESGGACPIIDVLSEREAQK